MDNNNISINDALPPELIRLILLRLSIKHLARLTRVSKLWRSLISDPDFAQSHLELSPAPTHRFLHLREDKVPQSIDLDALFRAGNHAAATREVSLPYEKLPAETYVLGSCRGLIALHQDPHSVVMWNPLTGSRKRISFYHRIVRNAYGVDGNGFDLVDDACLLGFGYDASKDDYLIVVAWMDNNEEYRFDFFSLRTNSWNSFDVALPNDPLKYDPLGLFFNGAIHWMPDPPNDIRDNTILVFDLTKRSFSEILIPERIGTSYIGYPVLLGECLSLCFWGQNGKTKIWVMKEYKVQSSWTSHEIATMYFQPLYLTNGGDVIGLDGRRGLLKYNFRGEFIQCHGHFSHVFDYTMYTESLLPLTNDSDGEEEGG